MTQLVRNLFLLILMGYSLTALPLNPELVTLDLSRFSYESALRNQASQGSITYAYVLNSSQKPLVNPDTAEFLIRAEGGKKPKWSKAPELTLEVLSGGKHVSTLTGNTFSEFLQPAEGFNPYELKYRLKLSKKNLSLDGSTYTLRIFSKDQDLSLLPPLEIPIQYIAQMKYSPAALGPTSGKQFITSYFSDSSGKYAVPTTREIPKSSKLFRTAVNQLLTAPPASMGLRPEPLTPRVSSIQYTSGLVICNFGAPVPAVLYTDPQLATVAHKAMTSSIAGIEGPYRISKIRYGWSGSEPVPGWPSGEIPVPSDFRIWLGLNIPDHHVLIVPVTTDKTSPEDLFTLLKTGTDGLIPTIPGSAKLLSTRMEGDILILQFEASFQHLFENSPDMAALAIDSLTQTFCQLPNVKGLRLEEGSAPIRALGGIEIPDPLVLKPYVNPESAFTSN